jgi:hypothetical protein
MVTIPQIPIDSLVDARKLAVRLWNSAPFHNYLIERLALVLPALLIFAVLSTAATAATIATIASQRMLLLPAFVLAPFLLIGGYAVAAYLFFSWLEGRALRRTLGHAPAGALIPRVPWVLTAVFLIVPALFLLLSWWKLALPLLALAAATPFAFARLDRDVPVRRR